LNIAHIYIKPKTPRLNGKVERSHRIDEEEFYRLLEGVVIEGVGGFNSKLQEWENFYNYERPHGALAGQALTSGYVTKLNFPRKLEPAAQLSTPCDSRTDGLVLDW